MKESRRSVSNKIGWIFILCVMKNVLQICAENEESNT